VRLEPHLPRCFFEIAANLANPVSGRNFTPGRYPVPKDEMVVWLALLIWVSARIIELI